MLDIVVPVSDQENDPGPGLRRLHAHPRETFPGPSRSTATDDAGTDGAPRIAARPAGELPEAEWPRPTEKDRGRALRAARSRPAVLVPAYPDADLPTGPPTEPAALLPLVAPLLPGHRDFANDTRLAPGARVVRGPDRKTVSRRYGVNPRAILGVGLSCAPRGSRSAPRDVTEQPLPLVRGAEWSFDTEPLVLAERTRLPGHEAPADRADAHPERLRHVRPPPGGPAHPPPARPAPARTGRNTLPYPSETDAR
ncbi:glycosyltransferase family 2 protein [Streptomyces sp. NPDC015220]|uniref:glycosyltransferase family 2 protein n=1 Tax=Streptomyces sp. NPDC015220 TaxID=3364947 RepID=UPI0036FA8FBE